MFRGIFVTGTDTNVGKTVVSAALLLRYRAEAPLRYWKPVQTGIEQDDDSCEVARLAQCRPDEIFNCGVRLPRPVSPHLAARLSGSEIAVPALVDLLRAQPPASWIVEGAGGLLVPLNERSRGPKGSAPQGTGSAPQGDMVADLIAALGLPVLVVARSTLGTINHTLLTLEALHRRLLRVAGVVMVGPPDDENRAAIEKYGDTEVIAAMPIFLSESDSSDPHHPSLTPEPERLASWASANFDRDGRLLGLLR
jgi:dethiobiotin synthetase